MCTHGYFALLVSFVYFKLMQYTREKNMGVCRIPVDMKLILNT